MKRIEFYKNENDILHGENLESLTIAEIDAQQQLHAASSGYFWFGFGLGWGGFDLVWCFIYYNYYIIIR